MNSFILIGDDSDRDAYIHQFANQHAIAKFDIYTFTPSENSFGIQDIRESQKLAFIKPLHSKEKILVFNKAELLTTEAQNALLKLLEEPPHNTFVFLSATSDAALLPTIVSRCKTIILQQQKSDMSEERKDELKEHRQIIEQGSVAQKLSLAESLSQDKEKLAAWLDDSVTELRESMLKEPTNTHCISLIHHLQKARTLLKTTNVSPRMILEHIFLSV